MSSEQRHITCALLFCNFYDVAASSAHFGFIVTYYHLHVHRIVIVCLFRFLKDQSEEWYNIIMRRA